MAQGPSDTILVAIRESKVRNPDPPDRRRFVLSEHSFLVPDEFSERVSIGRQIFALHVRRKDEYISRKKLQIGSQILSVN